MEKMEMFSYEELQAGNDGILCDQFKHLLALHPWWGWIP